jgi:hypothetical protein
MIEVSKFQSDLKQRYSRSSWETWLHGIFSSQIGIETVPENVMLQDRKAKSVKRFATIRLADAKNIAVLDIKTDEHIQIARNRVALREIAAGLIDHSYYHGLLVFYHSKNVQQPEYRLSFISSEATINETGNLTTQSTAPKRYTYVLGENESTRTAAERLKKIAEKAGNITLEDVKEAFSVEALTKEFYRELFGWYQWALSDEMGVTYPNDTSTKADDRIIQEHLIRLITRLVFVWFIKQKKLISDEIFDVVKLQDILKDFDSTSSTKGNYYNAILQNLFFATLNRPVNDRCFAANSSAGHQVGKEHYGIKTLYRDNNKATWFKKSQEEIINLFKKAPFLNGGLFECLDKEKDNNGKIFYYDGFSRENGRQRRAFIPNCLFFDNEKGLISILKKYNFTIEENTPNDMDIALDPELLGKVFENLLGYYNTETKETARKQSGSFYTPREIVSYMVDESLKAYIQTATNYKLNITNEELVIDETMTDEIKLNIYKALLHMKILDPACGSGAFPMGMLNRIINIFEEILPENLQKSIYELKLHLIENCIYGIDIQTIAIQISKLRFFISLVCEQTPTDDADSNYGIKPLPNLETKFVAANTLIGIAKKRAQGNLFEDPQIEATKKSLLEVRHEHFSADTARKKKECREKDKQLREKLVNLLKINDMFVPEDAKQLAEWNPYDQNATSPFFDPEWMFGLTQEKVGFSGTSGFFDVVIGNPPYGATIGASNKNYFKTNYKSAQTISGVQKGSLDTFTLFIEKGINSLKIKGNLSYIVPISITSSDSMTGVHCLLENNCSLIKVSSYAVRPQPIFENAVVNTSILFSQKDDKKCEQILTTKMYRKNKDFNLQCLINNLQFINIKDVKIVGRYPKISLEIEKSILQKIYSQNTKIKDLIREKGMAIYYRTTGGRYFKVITNYSTGSTKERPIYFDSKNANIIGAILSSNLFFWFYQIISNNLDLKTYEIKTFGFPIEKLNTKIIKKIETLYANYLIDIEKNANIRHTERYANIDSFKEYNIGKSKHLIDQIDDLICPLYGLSKEETEFIKNYEIKFRLSNNE